MAMTKVFTLADLFEMPVDDHSTDYYEILGREACCAVGAG